VQPPIPFGDITMVPTTLSGGPVAHIARAMMAALAKAPTVADVFNRLRQSFPLSPPSARMAALRVVRERLRRSF
jgi:hypothetical protein